MIFDSEIKHDPILERLNVAKYFYLMEYKKHYKDFLTGFKEQDRIIAELFLFRLWTTQFAFKLFCLNDKVYQLIGSDIVGQGRTFGKSILHQLENVNIEKVLNGEFLDLMDERWVVYDKTFSENKKISDSVPSEKICCNLLSFCNINDKSKLEWLSKDFEKHLNLIKEEIIKLGITKQS